MKINLSENGLGLQAATNISEIAFKIQNIHTLNLADNDFGEEVTLPLTHF